MSEQADESNELCDHEPPVGADDVEIEFSAEWRTDRVRAFARRIREGRIRGIERDVAANQMSALADELEQAGCKSEIILNHCRRCPDHFPDCWVVWSILHDELQDETPEQPGPTRVAVDRLADRVIHLQLLVIGVGVLLMIVYGLIRLARWLLPNHL
jgi:hypothetical protein